MALTSITDLTAAQARMISDYLPPLSDRPPGFDLAAWLSSMVAVVNASITAQNSLLPAVVQTHEWVPAAALIDDVAFDASLNGNAVTATLSTINGTKYIVATEWQGGGVLRIKASANLTAGDKITVVVYNV